MKNHTFTKIFMFILVIIIFVLCVAMYKSHSNASSLNIEEAVEKIVTDFEKLLNNQPENQQYLIVVKDINEQITRNNTILSNEIELTMEAAVFNRFSGKKNFSVLERKKLSVLENELRFNAGEKNLNKAVLAKVQCQAGFIITGCYYVGTHHIKVLSKIINIMTNEIVAISNWKKIDINKIDSGYLEKVKTVNTKTSEFSKKQILAGGVELEMDKFKIEVPYYKISKNNRPEQIKALERLAKRKEIHGPYMGVYYTDKVSYKTYNETVSSIYDTIGLASHCLYGLNNIIAYTKHKIDNLQYKEKILREYDIDGFSNLYSSGLTPLVTLLNKLVNNEEPQNIKHQTDDVKRQANDVNEIKNWSNWAYNTSQIPVLFEWSDKLATKSFIKLAVITSSGRVGKRANSSGKITKEPHYITGIIINHKTKSGYQIINIFACLKVTFNNGTTQMKRVFGLRDILSTVVHKHPVKIDNLTGYISNLTIQSDPLTSVRQKRKILMTLGASKKQINKHLN